MIVSKKSATDPKLKWFKDARLGMFVHFGPYALLERGEHTLNVHKMQRAEYEKLRTKFNPHRFNADEWIDVAEDMGARYITITAKHLDGFLMYDSALTDYKITNTPFGRDLVGELIEACHRRNMRICLYYSREEWHHRNYVHTPGVGYSLSVPLPDQKPDWPKYMEYFMGQLREMCTKYGRIDGFWFDAYGPSMPGDPTPKQVYDLIKHYQPGAVVNDRNEYGDFFTPERSIREGLAGYLLESCQAIGLEWGYIKDCALYSAPYLIQSVAHLAGLGGNFLLNFGPKADGTLPADRVAITHMVGEWVRRNQEAIFGTDSFLVNPATYEQGSDTSPIRATQRGKDIYLLLLEWPRMNSFRVGDIRAEPKSAELLGHKGKLTCKLGPNGLEIRDLPPVAPQMGVNVVKLSFRTVPKAPRVRESRPPSVPVSPVKATVLPSECARMLGFFRKGRRIRIRPEIGGFVADNPMPWQNVDKVLVDWMRPEQKAVWDVDCEKAGRYEVSIEVRCLKRLAGSEFTVKAAGQTLRGVVKATPLMPAGSGRPLSPDMACCRFVRQRVGVLRLPKGKSSITIQPTCTAKMGRFADVREVRLRPIKK